MVSFLRIFIVIGLQSLRQYLFYVRKIFVQHPTLTQSRSRKDIIRLKIYATFPTVMFEPSHRFFFNEPLTKDLRIACTYVSILTPLFDDYFEGGEVQQLKEIIAIKDEVRLEQPHLLVKLYRELKQHTLNHRQLSIDIDEVFQWQQQADRQKSEHKLSDTEIERLTREKSAIGFYLIMHLTNKEVDIKLRNIIDQLAFLLQLGDDVFDVWFDLQDQSQTLATNAMDATSLKAFYLNECKRLVNFVYDFTEDGSKANKFLRSYFFIISRVFVALHQYEAIDFNQARKQHAEHRKSLVCDMELFRNNISWISCYKELVGLLK